MNVKIIVTTSTSNMLVESGEVFLSKISHKQGRSTCPAGESELLGIYLEKYSQFLCRKCWFMSQAKNDGVFPKRLSIASYFPGQLTGLVFLGSIFGDWDNDLLFFLPLVSEGAASCRFLCQQRISAQTASVSAHFSGPGGPVRSSHVVHSGSSAGQRPSKFHCSSMDVVEYGVLSVPWFLAYHWTFWPHKKNDLYFVEKLWTHKDLHVFQYQQQ